MSIKEVKNTIEEFLLTDENNLLIIKGNWGVGKTYHWQQSVNQASKKKTIGKQKYAYISLFGVNDLETLKETLLFSIQNSNKVHSKGIFSKLDSAIEKPLQEISKLDFLKKYTGNVLTTIAFSGLSGALICFDDIERRGSSLSINHIFGLASLLKEQHNCKIVFILNDSKLKDEQKAYDSQKEKVADQELEFAPLPTDVFDFIFKESDENYDVIKRCCRRLEIKNIRTLQKIKTFISKIKRYLIGKTLKTKEVVLQSLILFVWAYFDKEQDRITLDALMGYSSTQVYVNKANNKESTELELELLTLLTRYDGWGFKEIDLPILSFVKHGFINQEELELQLNTLNEREIAREKNDDYSKAWDLYSNSFGLKSEKFTNELIQGLKKNLEFVELESIDSSVVILRRLDKSKSADSIVDQYVKIKNSKFIPQFAQTIFYQKIVDSYLKSKIKEVIDEYDFEYDFGQIIENIAFQNSPEYSKIEFLASHESSDYYDYFNSVNSHNLYWYIKGCLILGELKDEKGLREKIVNDTKKALKQIASENELDRIKIAGWFEEYKIL